MSIRVMTQVWETAPVSGGALLVMLALADFANDKGECWPSVETLGAKARITGRQTRAVLRQLETQGLVEQRGRTKYGTFIYRIRLGAEVSSYPSSVGLPPNRQLNRQEKTNANDATDGSDVSSDDYPDFRDPQIIWLEERHKAQTTRRAK